MDHVLVTGGSRGIGRGIVTCLADAGYKVTFTYVNDCEAAQEVAEGFGDQVEGFFLDQGELAAIPDNIESLESQRGAFDHLINNAGITEDGHFVLQPYDTFQRIMNVNFNGAVLITRQLVRGMMHRRAGRIINMVSSSGITGLPGQTAYASSKGAMISFTKALAVEVARFGILVNAVAPGLIGTEMTDGLKDKQMQQFMKNIPLKRVGTTEEVARLVRFLVSDDCGFMTGQVLRIDGGMLRA